MPTRPSRLSVVYDDGQEGRIDLEAAVIFDEAKLLELVHEGVHAGPRRPHHLSERLLRYSWQHALALVLLPEPRRLEKALGVERASGLRHRQGSSGHSRLSHRDRPFPMRLEESTKLHTIQAELGDDEIEKTFSHL